MRLIRKAALGLAFSALATAQLSAQVLAGVSDSVAFAELRFRSIGPAVMSGRVSDIAVPPASRPGERLGKTIYVASAAGGVWKSTNHGITWSPIFDHTKVSSIGAVAVAPSNADVVYVGTGESNNLRSSSWGEGVWKSTDAGKTWTHVGLRSSQHIARIIVHPTNPDIAYVAAMGPLWAAGGERGLYKTTDGGRTWTNTKSLGQYTGFTDVAFDPSNPNTLYATSFQRERKAYSAVAGGPETGIWKSTDAGATWTQLTNGLPTGDKGRTGISVSRSNPNTIYAHVDARDGGVYRSNDGGATWTKTSSTVGSFPWFTGQIRVDPSNPERVYIFPGAPLQVSNDGGKTFRTIANSTHADHHAMWIDPNDSDHIMIGNDGGFYVSQDAGATWDFALNLPVSTFYAIGVDMRDPYWVYGGLQDNGSWGAPVTSRLRPGIGNEMWVRAGGGDGFYAAIDPTDHNVVYVESQEGNVTRFDYATRESKGIRPTPRPNERLRWNWSAPLLISPHDNKTLYFAANLLFKSTNRGDSWERVSGDLTRALDRETLPVMGITGPGGYRRHESTAQFGNLSTIDESPVRRGLLYTGSDDGVVAVSRDGGANWTKIEKFPGVPDLTYVSRVIASRHSEGTAYATFDGHRNNDFKPYVYKTTDFGRTWTSITNNLPEGSVYVIREHHRDPNLLVVGAEYGVFVSVNGGRSWTQLKSGIAPAPVHDLIIHPRANDLVVGTHGRGLYILEDLSVLENLATVANVKVARPRSAVVFNTGAGYDLPGDRHYAAPNAPAGAPLSYVVPSSAANSTAGTLVVTDAQSRVVRELRAPLTAGVHRVQWDLRHAPAVAATQPERPAGDDAPAQFQQGSAGPYVAPGTYTVQLKSGTQVLAQAPIEVRADPAVRLTAAEWTTLTTARSRAYDLQVRANRLATQLDAARRQLADAMRGKDSTSAAFAQARALDEELRKQVEVLRGAPRPQGQGGPGGGGQFGGAAAGLVGRINTVVQQIGSNHFLPTPDHNTTVTEVSTALQKAEADSRGPLGRVASVVRSLGA